MASKRKETQTTFRLPTPEWKRFDKAARKVGASKAAILRGLVLQFCEGVEDHGGTPQYVPTQQMTNHIGDLVDES